MFISHSQSAFYASLCSEPIPDVLRIESNTDFDIDLARRALFFPGTDIPARLKNIVALRVAIFGILFSGVKIDPFLRLVST